MRRSCSISACIKSLLYGGLLSLYGDLLLGTCNDLYFSSQARRACLRIIAILGSCRAALGYYGSEAEGRLPLLLGLPGRIVSCLW